MRAHTKIARAAAGVPGRAMASARRLTHRADAAVGGNQAALARIGRNAGSPDVEAALQSPSRPLDAQTRTLMERRFGRPFGRVRIHTGAEAAASARSLDAQAYTLGNDIVFGAGRYAPASSQGRGLLAHELAHVAQQEGSRPTTDLPIDETGSKPERQAGTMATAAAQGRPVPAPIRAARRVMRATRTFSLTFDDGPHAAPLGGGRNLTENVLDTLKARSIKAAFFIQTGVAHRMANAIGRKLVARMQAEGHKVGIHTGGTADHELHTRAEAAGRLEGELQAGKAAVKKVTGSEPTLVRPPTGALNPDVEATYSKVGLTNLLWDIDVDQGANKSLADLKKRVEAGVAAVHGRGWKTTTPSSTIVTLLHDIQRGTANNLGAIIDHIKTTVSKISGGKDSADFTAP